MEEGAEAPSEHPRVRRPVVGFPAAMEEGAEAPSECSCWPTSWGLCPAAMEEGAEAPSELLLILVPCTPVPSRNGGGRRSALGGLAFYSGADLGVRAICASGWFGGLVVAAFIWLSRCLKPKSIRLASGPRHWWSDLTSRIR